jgi:hypothetical protein
MTPTLRAEGMSVTSPPFKRTVSPTLDPYKLSTPKHWCIIHHIQGPSKELLYEFLNYKRNTWPMKCSTLKHSGSETEILALGDTRARIDPMMQSPQLLLTGRAPKSPPSPRAHHWATPIYHSSRNTQSSLHTIRSTSKPWATKAQQDWPVNVTINNRQLACKAEIGGALCHAKPALWVDPYLSSFSSNQLIPLVAFMNQLYSNYYN